ncbi:SCO-spondin-like [Branchiostoma floridae x Branchiostoma japonicum]
MTTSALGTTAIPRVTTSATQGTTAIPGVSTTSAPGTTAIPGVTTSATPGATTIPVVTITSALGTTAIPGVMTTSVPGTLAISGVMTTSAPGTTAIPGVSTSSPPGTTAIPGVTTTSVPGTLAISGVMTTSAPGTTAIPGVSTTSAPGTTAISGVTTTSAPGTTAISGLLITSAPGTTAIPGVTTTSAPGTTSIPAVTTTSATPGTTTIPGGSTTSALGTTAIPGVSTTSAPGTTAIPGVSTTSAAGTTAIPGVTTFATPGTTAIPGVSTTSAPGTTSIPGVTTFATPGTTAIPGVKTTSAPGTTYIPGVTTSATPGTTAIPGVTTSATPGTMAIPGVTTSATPGTTAIPGVTTSATPGTTTIPGGTTTSAPGTTAIPGVTTSATPGATAIPGVTTSATPGTTTIPGGTTTSAPGTTAIPGVTTSATPGATAIPGVTTSATPGTTTIPGGTTTSAPGTTAIPGVTTSATLGATAIPGVTTFASPGTTTIPGVSTTSALGTTAIPGVMTTSALGTTAIPRMTTSATQGTTAIPGVSTTSAPGTTAIPGVTTAATQGTTAIPGVSTTSALGTTAIPGVMTTSAPGTTAILGVMTTSAPGTTAIPGVTTTSALGTTAIPGVSTTSAPGTTAIPGLMTTSAPGTTAIPGVMTTSAPGTTAIPAVTTTSATPGTTAIPGVMTTSAPGTTAISGVSTTSAPGTTAIPGVSTTSAPGTTAIPAVTTTSAPGTTPIPGVTTFATPGTTAIPGVKTTSALGTTVIPGVTTSATPGTTAIPGVTTFATPGTMTIPGVSTTSAPGTTAIPRVTTSATQGTTAIPGLSTTSAPGTTTIPAVTTTSLPGTTAIPVGRSTSSPGVTPTSSAMFTGTIPFTVTVTVVSHTSISGQCNSEFQFTCSNGDCIGVSLRCDGFSDCSDGSDETECVDCVYGSWGLWSACSSSCGLGSKQRGRDVIQEAGPGGIACNEMALTDHETCYVQPCPLDGGWADWSSWTECDVSCDGGVQTRWRTCTNPTPKDGGQDCYGDWMEMNSCNTVPCELTNCPEGKMYISEADCLTFNPCPYACASLAPEAACLAVCEPGCYCEAGTVLEAGECVPIQDCRCFHGGVEYHPGQAITDENCHHCECSNGTMSCTQQECPVDCGWSAWTTWTVCDKSCGLGYQERFRSANNPVVAHGGQECTGDSHQMQPCNVFSCPAEWSDWSNWTACSSACDGGERTRTRACIPDGLSVLDCPGNNTQTMPCNTDSCGETCTGDKVYKECDPCPHSCTDLQDGVQCIQDECLPGCYCPDGQALQDGQCVPETQCRCRLPLSSGSSMEIESGTTVVKDCTNCTCDSGSLFCEPGGCPVDGGWTVWTPWTVCSKQCVDDLGTVGSISRYRNCTNPQPQHGGETCGGMGEEREDCNTHRCPVDGQWGAWSPWSSCSQTCSGGSRIQHRVCDSPASAYGGEPCAGPASQTMECGEPCLECPAGMVYLTEDECGTTCPRTCAELSSQVMCTSSCQAGCHCADGKVLQDGECVDPTQCRCTYQTQEVPPGTVLSYDECNNCTCVNGNMECDTAPCPVDCGWCPWSTWGECSKTCGAGVRSRYRSGDNPPPQNGGKICEGPATDIDPCNTQPCEVPLVGWSAWTNWTSCTATCENGLQYRYRECPEGESCDGDAMEETVCYARICIYHGNWGAWSTWTTCSASCGTGFTARQRECNNPAPSNGGNFCEGSATEGVQCNMGSCNAHLCENITGSVYDDCGPACPRSCEDMSACVWSCQPGCYCPSGLVLNENRTACVDASACSCLDLETDTRHPPDSVITKDCNQCVCKNGQFSCTGEQCEVPGGWCYWGAWSMASCQGSCDSMQTRQRVCACPAPISQEGMCADVHSLEEGYGLQQENAPCEPYNPCPVDGNWTEWSVWSGCEQCMAGSEFRTRSCANPPPQHGGEECTGNHTMSRPCQVDTELCGPECSPGLVLHTCHTGSLTCLDLKDSNELMENHTCTAACTCPGEQLLHNGTCVDIGDCPCTYREDELPGYMPVPGAELHLLTLTAEETISLSCNNCTCTAGKMVCTTAVCEVDGNWSLWSTWSVCSVPCGGGAQYRHRSCDNPAPANGGQACAGLDQESQSCNEQLCTGGNETVAPGWSSWSAWSTCTASCDGGQKTRARACTSPAPQDGEDFCEGGTEGGIETVLCNTQQCPCLACVCEFDPAAEFGDGSVTGSLTDGTVVSAGQDVPSGSSLAVQCNLCVCQDGVFTCTQDLCKVDGGVSEWSGWSNCSLPCGGLGTRTRTRDCSNPAPENGGLDCTAALTETVYCQTPACPVAGSWSEWSSWGSCSATCGGGSRQRLRTCTNPAPLHGGTDCQGVSTQTQECNLQECDTGCSGGKQYTTLCSPCPHTCAEQAGTAECVEPETCEPGCRCPQGLYEQAGQCVSPEVCRCEGDAGAMVEPGQVVTQNCSTCVCLNGMLNCTDDPSCFVTPGWSAWEVWTPCSKSCIQGVAEFGSSVRSRRRYCTDPPPSTGQDSCVGDDIEEQICNVPECPLVGGWTEWSQWSACTVTCGAGTSLRYRNCTIPPPSLPDLTCEGSAVQTTTCMTESDCEGCPAGQVYHSCLPCPRTCLDKQNHVECVQEECVPGCGCPSGQLLSGDSCVEEDSCPCSHVDPADSGASPVLYSDGDVVSISCNNCTCTAGHFSCSNLVCDVDCTWNTWSTWSVCSLSCGVGERSRHRTYNPAQGSGAQCASLWYTTETQDCNTHACSVNGEWGQWSAWTPCDASCDSGSSYRSRTCDNPPPKNGGNDCEGEHSEMTLCNTDPCDGTCPDSLVYDTCAITCGHRCSDFHQDVACVDAEECSPGCRCPQGWYLQNGECVLRSQCECVDSQGQQWAPGSTQIQGCNNCTCADGQVTCGTDSCPVDCVWSAWSSWTACTATCGPATRTRYRSDNNPPASSGGAACEGISLETQSCELPLCPAVCYGPNGEVTQVGETYQPHPCTECQCTANDWNCQVIPCSQAGSWSAWLEWSECPVTCGSGQQSRVRACSDPAPLYGGADCEGNNMEMRPCGQQACHVPQQCSLQTEVRNLTRGECVAPGVEVQFCSGACPSYTDIVFTEPYVVTVCECCSYVLDALQPTQFVTMTCQGSGEDSLVLPRIASCNCASEHCPDK